MSSFLTPASLIALIAASMPSSRGVCSRLRPYFEDPSPTIATLSIIGFRFDIGVLLLSRLLGGPEGRRRIAVALDPRELDGHARFDVRGVAVDDRREVPQPLALDQLDTD